MPRRYVDRNELEENRLDTLVHEDRLADLEKWKRNADRLLQALVLRHAEAEINEDEVTIDVDEKVAQLDREPLGIENSEAEKKEWVV